MKNIKNIYNQAVIDLAKKFTKEQKEDMLKAFKEKMKDNPDKENLIKQMEEALGYDSETKTQPK